MILYKNLSKNENLNNVISRGQSKIDAYSVDFRLIFFIIVYIIKVSLVSFFSRKSNFSNI